jgi:hypothetical protein
MATLKLINGGASDGDGGKPAKDEDPYAYRLNLPFVKRYGGRGRALHWWHVNPTGDFCKDYDTGREYALEFLRQCANRGNMGTDLSNILWALHEVKRTKRRRLRNGKYVKTRPHGIELGFMRGVGELFQSSMLAIYLVKMGPDRFAARNISQKEMDNIIATAVDLVLTLSKSHGSARQKPALTVVPNQPA